MANYFPPKKNDPFVFHTSLVSQADTKLLQSSPTLAVGDVKIRIDDAALTNIATLPTASGKLVKVSLSAAEMNGDNVTVLFSDAAGAEWCDKDIELQTSVNNFDALIGAAGVAASQATIAASGVNLSSVEIEITSNEITP